MEEINKNIEYNTTRLNIEELEKICSENTEEFCKILDNGFDN